MRSQSHLKTMRTLAPFLWEFRGRALAALGFLVVAKLASVALPMLLKHIVDTLNNSPQRLIGLPLALLLGYGGLRLVSTLSGALRDLVFVRVSRRAVRRIALRVFRHLHNLDLGFHLARQTGGLSRDIERGSRGISFVLSFMLFNILPTFLEIAFVVGIFIVKFSGWFTLTIFLAIATYILFSVLITEWRMPHVRRVNELDSDANTRAIDSLLNYETVKYFTNEEYEARNYDERLTTWENASVKNQLSLSTLNIGQACIIAAGVLAIMVLAARGVVDQRMSIGDLVMVNAYMLQLFAPLNHLGFVYRQIKRSLADMERMFALLERHAAVADQPGAPALAAARGALRFDGVRFGYNAEREILHGVSFVVPAGKKLAVVGPSGAGKSTLARLLFRFYDVDAGRISIAGRDIRHVDQSSLRREIGIVPQDTVLFNESIYYNIAYGDPHAEPAAVLRAAKLAQLHKFIESLPRGYETQVGERGLKLSGGEKQRVAIARTILKDPPILLLDEATSSLDSHAEQAILAALAQVSAERTTLAIAHRLSTVADADEIVVLDGGRIVERGEHFSLLRRGGLYTELWELQQREARQAPDAA